MKETTGMLKCCIVFTVAKAKQKIEAKGFMLDACACMHHFL